MALESHDQPHEAIQIVGARTHNLKNVTLDIPRDRLVVITGRSGSGKSSLAIDTIFAEGQRQYIESLSFYSRQFFKQLPQADVDLIAGLPPTLCLDQKHGVTNRRSTVGTITEVYDYLRLLMARVGKIHCYGCGEPITQHTPQQIRDQLLGLAERTKIMVLAPLQISDPDSPKTVLQRIRRERLVRVRIEGEIVDIDQIPETAYSKIQKIAAVTDRIIIRDGVAGRLLEAIEFADRLTNGRIVVCSLQPDDSEQTWNEQHFSTQYACPDCEIQYAEVQPRTFSFNSPHGACNECQGLGAITEFDPQLVVPDRKCSLDQNAIAPWKRLGPTAKKKQLTQLNSLLEHVHWSVLQPLDQMTDEQWIEFLRCPDKDHPGLLMLLTKEMSIATDVRRQDELLEYQSVQTCHACHGWRLAKPALSVFLSGNHIGQIIDMPIDRAILFFDKAEFDMDQQQIAAPLLKEILHRLKFLQEVGVGYLSLGRGSNTLSGGEHQRVRLATSIGSGLTNVFYVLDEPSIGLHQRDNERLIESIRKLQQAGNSVLLVEHDEATIRVADHIIDIGPAAGVHGGQVIAQGSPAEISNEPASLTGDYLAGRRRIETPTSRRSISADRCITITKASGRNLQDVSLDIPLGVLVCITGVSGSGKSTLINQTLAPAMLRELERAAPMPQPHESLSGLQQVDRLILVDQKPIGKSPRGCPATVTGIFSELRKVFAATKKAKQLGFGASRFSFNSSTGWCPECRGHGVKRIEMNFMPDFFVSCDSCDGRRFNLQTLQVRFNEQSIADVLAMSIERAREFFDGFESVARPLQSLIDVGLGYLKLGQSTVTLSGGESQRVKLATELARPESGNTLYILDEPTTGLHFEDIRVLLVALNRLVDQGNSMIIIEHNLDVIRCADWIVDLGPEGGEAGGKLMGCGTPEDVAKIKDSYTGQFLSRCL